MLLIQPSSKTYIKPYASLGLDNHISNYGNMSIPGEFHSERFESCFSEFCNIYKPSNFVKKTTHVFILDKPSSIYLFLTNR